MVFGSGATECARGTGRPLDRTAEVSDLTTLRAGETLRSDRVEIALLLGETWTDFPYADREFAAKGCIRWGTDAVKTLALDVAVGAALDTDVISGDETHGV